MLFDIIVPSQTKEMRLLICGLFIYTFIINMSIDCVICLNVI